MNGINAISGINYKYKSSTPMEVVTCRYCGKERIYYSKEYIYTFNGKKFCCFDHRCKWQKLMGHAKEQDYGY